MSWEHQWTTLNAPSTRRVCLRGKYLLSWQGGRGKQRVLFLEIKSSYHLKEEYEFWDICDFLYLLLLYSLFSSPVKDNKPGERKDLILGDNYGRRMLRGPCLLCSKSWVKVMVENTQRDNGLSWRKESKQGSCGLLKKENSALGWEVVLRFNRLLFALYPWGLGDKSSHFRLVRLLLFGLLLWVRITTTSVAFCSDHSLLNTPAPVKFFLPVKHYRLTRGPPGLSGPHLGQTVAQMMHD